MKVLIFIGAGASYELGVPTMRPMAEQFRRHLHDLALPPVIVEKMDRLIDDGSKDMEHAIDVIDRLEGGYAARLQMGEPPDEAGIAPYRTIRHEAEWFVQHSCEQIRSEAAITMWSPILRASRDVSLTIASTNYDRAVEIAAARLSLTIDDGFEEFDGQEVSSWRGFSNEDSLKLLKLHGSTDWYRGSGGQIIKLRHPMPLFGGLTVGGIDRLREGVKSALILPSREKVITLPPFPELAAEFRQRAKEADIAIFIGSSLRDPHMRDVCVFCARLRPTFVVSRSGHFEVGIVPEGAKVITQSAGRFLVSTLPIFLREQNLGLLIDQVSGVGPDEEDVLASVVLACNENSDSRARCAAIEKLATAHVSLGYEELTRLLQSKDADVAIFSLGLIPDAVDRDPLFAKALSLSATKGDEFLSELATLKSLMGNDQHKESSLGL